MPSPLRIERGRPWSAAPTALARVGSKRSASKKCGQAKPQSDKATTAEAFEALRKKAAVATFGELTLRELLGVDEPGSLFTDAALLKLGDSGARSLQEAAHLLDLDAAGIARYTGLSPELAAWFHSRAYADKIVFRMWLTNMAANDRAALDEPVQELIKSLRDHGIDTLRAALQCRTDGRTLCTVMPSGRLGGILELQWGRLNGSNA
jgi:hypothetical protein